MPATTNPYPTISLPAGAEWDGDWQPDEPQAYRIIYGADQSVEGHDLTMWTTATQYADGSIDIDSEPPTVNLQVSWDKGLTSDQARELSALVLKAAADIDRWVAEA